MEEVWRDIKGYEGFYQVSNMGNIKSLRRLNNRGQVVHEKILKPPITRGGYLRLFLSINGVKKAFAVQRLVASSFLENEKNKSDVNHINGIKTDNRLCNLEWATRSENVLHAFKNNLHVSVKGSKNGMSKISESDVLEIRKLLSQKVPLRKIGAAFGLSHVTIIKINLGAIWKHV